ncbi:glycoside hydrolase family 78 protein [Cellulomonas sp. URHD0024]|uniref:glycoside hydrolase family 78 protein n=1 Tax=Cellulomonas sp. URHD0024 TaxID=1302620 RepID=UPI000400FB6E|nr:glycoside hydrolase family 78 protein [Cellulomonas sp. URHD0024]
MTATVAAVRVEHLERAIGISEAEPRLSWILRGARRGPGAIAYELEIARDSDATRVMRIEGPDSVLVRWPAAPLQSRERATVRVRALFGDDAHSSWSEPTHVERGLDAADWAVDFVSPSPSAPRSGPRPAHLLRAQFDVPATVRRARLYVAAHGVYDLEVNGAPAEDAVLQPGWTSFRHRLRAQTFELDDLLDAGSNVLGIWLADGWYRGRLGFNGGLWDVYGDDVAVMVQLELLHGDGSLERVPLDWRTSESAITATGLYEGESYDARRHPLGWNQVGFDDSSWVPTTNLARDAFSATIEGPAGPPVRVVEDLAPVAVERRLHRRVRLDFGQNISGRVSLRATATRGHQLTVRHAEVIENDELCVRPLRTASSIDRYTFSGDGPETWEPRFTLHGFRYVEIDGWPDGQEVDVVARVIHSDMRRAGWFSSSSALLDQFHENVVWSMRDNFVDLPTDCPQRDERLGWTGDIQAFAPAATFLYESTGVLRSWLRDLAAEQQEFGSVRNFHPWLECGFPADPAAGWGDAAVLVPWTIYERTGDLAVLDEQLPSMTAWVDQVDELTGRTGLWADGFQLGDWLDPQAPPERPGDSATDPYLVATAYHAHTASITARACEALGRPALAQKYGAVADRARHAFQAEYVTSSGRVVSDTVTALSLAICFDLLPTDAHRGVAGRRLAELVRDGDHLIRTGFIGTPLVCDALVATGSVDTAYHLLLQTRCPSWLFPVTMGATTVWERWDSMLPDGSVNPGEMTSFNHYALGAVVDFLHRIVAGLAPAAPGYERVRIAPRPGGGLTHASAAHLSPYGMIRTGWRRDGATVVVEVDVPFGVEAEVELPGDDRTVRVGGGSHTFQVPYRAAADDPTMPRLWNIHSPEDRLEMSEEGVTA